ncbi:RNA polymerase sigma factor SigJ [Actinoplanes sp. CA-054009]
MIENERRRLTNLAYRMLGSLAEAEDAVQETYARWFAMSETQRGLIASPPAWLTRVAGRICLDQLGSARVRRERYVGEWIPEPLPEPGDGMPADPAERITLDESVTMAFLVVLESMTPAERVAFVLHDVFRYPFAEVADIVGRTPAACRQLASSARRRMEVSRAPATPAARQAGVVRDFKQAWEAMDIGALIGLLDPAATAVTDGGGRAPALLEPLTGGERIARAWVELASKAGEFTMVERSVSGRPGLVVEIGGEVVTVFSFEVAGDRITHIWAVRNPEKLRPWNRYRARMAETQRKPVPRNDDGEIDTAIAFLDFARESVLKKAEGLSDEQLRRVLVPTGTNLLGLIAHLTEGERYWFGYTAAGEKMDEPDFAMAVPGEVSTGEVVAAYRAAIEHSNAIVRAAADLGTPVDGQFLSLRWVLAHMTSETARHAGHADILRELIDGTTGR